MSWLVSDARVLASAEVATTGRERRRGLLGRDGIDGALVIERCRWVHTFGMRFPIDVAHVDADDTVIRVTRMRRHRLGRPVRHAQRVIEAEAGAFARWGLGIGDHVEVRLDADDAERAERPAPDAHRPLPPPTPPAATSSRSRSVPPVEVLVG